MSVHLKGEPFLQENCVFIYFIISFLLFCEPRHGFLDCLDTGFFFPNTLQAFFRSREIREFASGALAGAMSKAVLAPLETIR
jgi:hypothetical protein